MNDADKYANTHVLNPHRYEHVMVDFETYALEPWLCAVSSVALLHFNPLVEDEMGARTEPLGKCYQVRFDKQTRRFFNSKTVAWREEHNVDEQEAHLPMLPPLIALREMALFCATCCLQENVLGPPPTEYGKELVIWAKPKEFDLTIWESLCNENGLAPPWFRRNAMCVNTWCNAHGFAPYPLLKQLVAKHDFGPAHDALVDCKVQVAMVRSCLWQAAEECEDNEEQR